LAVVYFTTGSPGAGDINVADMTFDVEHKYADRRRVKRYGHGRWRP
jgi:hypothetical protein